jgi:hypothetical protein
MPTVAGALLFTGLAGCPWTEDDGSCVLPGETAAVWFRPTDPAVDDDGDGFSENDGDCDDVSCLRFPGAEEYRDGIDRNCDGEKLFHLGCDHGGASGAWPTGILLVFVSRSRRRSARGDTDGRSLRSLEGASPFNPCFWAKRVERSPRTTSGRPALGTPTSSPR